MSAVGDGYLLLREILGADFQHAGKCGGHFGNAPAPPFLLGILKESAVSVCV